MNINPETGQPLPNAGWFSRNWKWVLGLGCGIPLLCCAGSLAVGGLAGFKAINDNEVYADVMKKVATSPQAMDALGPPVAPSGFPQLNIQSRGGESRVELRAGFKGKLGSGTVTANAVRKDGKISYSKLELLTDKGERVDLRDPTESPPEPDVVDPSNPAPREDPMPDQPEDE